MTTPRFDPLDPAVHADPYPTFRELRAAGGLCRGGPGTWVVSRYDDVHRLLRDDRVSHRFPDEFRRFLVGTGDAADLLQRIVSSFEPPEHDRLRALIRSAIGPDLVAAVVAAAAAEIDRRLAAGRAAGGLDAVSGLAVPVAASVVGALLGDSGEVARHAAAAGRAFTALALSPDEHATADGSVRALVERVASTDLFSRLAAVRVGGERLTDREVVDNAVFVAGTAADMVNKFVGTAVVTLLRHPDQFARLRRDPSLQAAAVEEVLRFDPPMQGTARLVVRPVEVAGRTVRAGRVLFLLLGSANRDERRFDRPDSFDAGRTPNPHLAFGGGIHGCLGGALARGVGAALLARLATGGAEYEIAGPVLRAPGSTQERSYISAAISVA